ISFSWPATSSCNCSLSTTQGPAIRKNGWSSPTSNPQSFIRKGLFLPRIYADKSGFSRIGQKRMRWKKPGRPRSPRTIALRLHPRRSVCIRADPWQSFSPARFLQELAASLALARGADEADEEGMAAARGRQELGMRLAGDEPRVVGQFDHFHQQ